MRKACMLLAAYKGLLSRLGVGDNNQSFFVKYCVLPNFHSVLNIEGARAVAVG
jgi:hypothetical protein